MANKKGNEPGYRELQGELTAAGLRFAVVVSRFNAFITERLLQGALDGLSRAGAGAKSITVARVPGAFEIPVAAKHLAESGQYDAVLCLGTVIRGETPHFEYISAAVVSELERLMVDHRLPVALGVLTTDNVEQALERSGGQHGNKGAEAADTAVEMATLRKAFVS